jgi:hypothetical protein
MATKKKTSKKAAPKKATTVAVEEAVTTEATRIQKIRAYKDQQAVDFNKKFRK